MSDQDKTIANIGAMLDAAREINDDIENYKLGQKNPLRGLSVEETRIALERGRLRRERQMINRDGVNMDTKK